jgi:hypothetical protein
MQLMLNAYKKGNRVKNMSILHRISPTNERVRLYVSFTVEATDIPLSLFG